MINKLPYSVKSVEMFSDNTFYSAKIESLKERPEGLVGIITFSEKDFSKGVRPKVIFRYDSESYFGVTKFDIIMEDKKNFSDYKRVIFDRISGMKNVSLDFNEFCNVFTPIEKELRDLR